MSIAAQRKESVNCDYSRIADVHDQQACVAYILLVSLYETSFATETFTEISWDQAMEKAALILGDAETLEAKDPELARRICEKMQIADPDVYLNELVSEIRESFKSGEIDETHPNYKLVLKRAGLYFFSRPGILSPALPKYCGKRQSVHFIAAVVLSSN